VIDHARGALLGLAVGDALGASVEFMSPGTFPLVTTMRGGGVHKLNPGQWTDDTSMALCLAESLIECSGFDARDQMERYIRWWREGYLSSTGECFDIGNATVSSLQRYLRTHEPFAGSTNPETAGNGSLMRLAPIAIRYANSPDLGRMVADSSRTTHAAPAAVDACRYFASLLTGALQGVDKSRLLSPDWWDGDRMEDEVADVVAGSFTRKEPPQIQGTGYVVRSLEAALWAFYRTDCFEDAVLTAVNLGDDADTTGAVCGQLAGAYYGEQAIPQWWVEPLSLQAQIKQYADELLRHPPNLDAALLTVHT
jgi:ADP-ribosyl-[dinitrogen reductase] hydrolase